MRRSNPVAVIVAVVLGTSGVLLGLFVVSWFLLFVLVLMFGLLIMLRPRVDYEPAGEAAQTSPPE